MEKVTKVSRTWMESLVSRKFERFITLLLSLVLGDSVVKMIGLFGNRATGTSPGSLMVLLVVWAIVTIVSQFFDEHTLIGKLVITLLLPKIEERVLEVGTSLLASAMPPQSQPSTDAKNLNQVLDALDKLPGELPK